MSGDWIKLHRQSLDSQVFSDPVLWRLFCWCLMRANWKPGWFRGVEIPAGSFATGREAAGEQLGMSGLSWYRSMQKLQEFGLIELNANNRFTVISVVKWSFFQNAEQRMNNERTTDEQPPNNERTTDEQPMNTIEEGKKVKKVKKEKKSGATAPAAAELVRGTLPTKEGKDWELKESYWQELIKAYPRHDVYDECKRMKIWLLSNTQKQPTARGMTRFINAWLARSTPTKPERRKTAYELGETAQQKMEKRAAQQEAERSAKESANANA